jgi:hypothetical protein
VREALALLAPKQSDFIVCSPFLMQMLFSGALRGGAVAVYRSAAHERKGLNARADRKLQRNIAKLIGTTGLREDDRRVPLAVCAHRWGLIKCREYTKLPEEIRAEITGEKFGFKMFGC